MIEIKKNGYSAFAYSGCGCFANYESMSDEELELLDKEVQNRIHRSIAPILYDYIKQNATSTKPVTIKNIVFMLDIDYGIIANEKPIGKILKDLENEEIFGIKVVQFKGIYYDKNKDSFKNIFKKAC